ncbi:MAG: M20 family metallopeptidase [Promethearchaeota archaeon]
MINFEQQILKKIKEMKENIIAFHQDIVRIPSENPPGKYKKISNFIESKFKELGLSTLTKRKNVIGTLKNGEGPALIVYGHMDTVPALEGWTRDPFGAELRDGKIHGRGACDDKACVTAEFFATKVLLELGIELKGTLNLLSVVNEETGGFNGAKYLVEHGYVAGDGCLLGDGRGGYPAFCSGGFALLTFDICGKTAHALNFPDLPPPYRNESSGINAIKKMIKVLNFLEHLQEEFLKTETKFPNFPGHPSKITTVNLSKILGGEKMSGVPDTCKLFCVLNTIPEQDVGSIKKRIENFVEKAKTEDPYLNLNVHCAFSFEPFITDTNTRIAKAVRKAMKITHGEEREFKMFQAANDGHFFAEQGIPTIMVGTGTHKNNVHAPNEFVHVEELLDTVKIFALTIYNFFSE